MTECTRVDQELVDYLEGELALDARGELESHVARCPRCRATLHSYRTIQEAYRAVPEADVGAHVAGSILEAARRRPTVRRRVRRALLVAAGLALCVSIAVLAARLRERPDRITELVQRAEAQRAAGDLRAASSSYQEARALAGDDERAGEILRSLAALQVEQGEFQRAVATLADAIWRRPALEGRRDVLLLRAEALEGAGRRAEAMSTYLEVAKQFPEDRAEMERRVKALAERDDLEALRSLGYVGD